MKKTLFVTIFFISNFLFLSLGRAFNIDFSRRIKKEESAAQVRNNTEISIENKQFVPEPPPVLPAQQVVSGMTPANDIVILNTESGFVPKSVTLRKGIPYRFHVVNVNEKEKNVSFIMNSFNQHHGTYFGQIKVFDVTPNQEGIYTYQSPETAFEGRIVVIPPVDQQRSLATED